jgi:para-nitrobenzyl esterase
MRVRRLFSMAALWGPILPGCATTQPPEHDAAVDLGGTSWQLVKFQGSDDTTLTPDDKAKYTIAFGSDGRVSARIDCNRGVGTWKSSGPNQLQFGRLALTRAMCPPESLHDRIVKHWEFVRSYIIKDGRLFLSLMADGGIYEFEPIGRSKPASLKPPVAFKGNFR